MLKNAYFARRLKNQAKSDKVTDRARVFAKELYDAKLLSEEVLLRP